MIRKISFVVILILIILSVWIFAQGANLQSRLKAPESSENDATEITLRNTEEKEFSPDIANLILGVETEGEDLEAVLEENSEKMEIVTEELESKEDLSIDTSNFSINTVNDEDREELSYMVQNQIKIETSNIDELGLIIQTAVENGANRVNSINYLLEDRQEAEKEVTDLALNRLEEKSEFVAQNLGKEEIKLDSLEINDEFFRGSNNIRYEVRDMNRETGAVPPVSPENIRVQVEVEAVYRVE
ncbi:MAG: SIMPL domain-containing protein [Bacillota bacterium]